MIILPSMDLSDTYTTMGIILSMYEERLSTRITLDYLQWASSWLFVKYTTFIYRQLSCSPDSTTNSEATNPEFS